MPAPASPKDFYLNDRSAAAYFEKDWFDFASRAGGSPIFAYPPYPAEILAGRSHETLIASLKKILVRRESYPTRLLEIGSSLGRTFFEICRQIPSVQSAELFEPSRNLWRLFNTIFAAPTPVRMPTLKGNGEITEVGLDVHSIRETCAHVRWNCLNERYQDLDLRPRSFDLTVCANVVDQCEEPEALVIKLSQATAEGGFLALSCTYQWQNKYTGNASRPIKDIRDLFGTDWSCLAEENIPFEFRVNERHWMKFLSHACIFERR